MTDPLSLLREYNMKKLKIEERDDHIIFGEYSWPKNVNTNWMCHISKEGVSTDRYTLECLVFFLKNLHLFHPSYCNAARAANIQAVQRPDRKKVLAYLNGDIATSDSIVNTNS